MMQQNAFATDFRLRCNSWTGSTPCGGTSAAAPGRSRPPHQPQARCARLAVWSVQHAAPNANAPVSGRTVVYTVYQCRRVGARPLSVTFPHDNNALMGYVSALERAMMLLDLHHLPALAIRLWPYAHAFGPSGSDAAAVAGRNVKGIAEAVQ
ncbi:hypothetical protein niasHS_000845 [Heterodera schachtii]|uniref:Uncharacterized protein n=1 Tax=Heterodera schachtii TaxID=97005 RepID=A0ABD2KLQ6_HETSC